MIACGTQSSLARRAFTRLACGVMLCMAAGAVVEGQQPKINVLRIATSGMLTDDKASKEDSAQESLKSFIKEQTGLDNEIERLNDWRELADKMAKGEYHIGVFQGYEYAWAQEKHPELKPLALAVNVYTYPVAYIVTNQKNKAKTFADLQGQTLAIPSMSQRFLRLFAERESGSLGKKPEDFFSKIATPENVEDALDDTVDGVVAATVVDRAGLEAFKRRKPGRFKNLREVAHSNPVLPPLVAYYGKTLDTATLDKLRTGLLEANRKEKGETLLTLFRFTGFVNPPKDFNKVLEETRKSYAPTENKSK